MATSDSDLEKKVFEIARGQSMFEVDSLMRQEFGWWQQSVSHHADGSKTIILVRLKPTNETMEPSSK